MLYIFDKDGTLVSGLGNRPANTPAEQQPLPNVIEKIAALRTKGHQIAIASNQGGVAWGFISEQEANELVVDCGRKIGGNIDAFEFCPYDPRAIEKNPNSPYAKESPNRKPAPGMLKHIMSGLGFVASDTIMIGDQESDKQAAEAAGVRFEWAADFFGWNR